MKTFVLSAKNRSDIGKKASRELRKQNIIPVNIYGLKKENINALVEEAAVRDLIFSPDIYAVDMDLDGQKMMCVLKEIQFHPVTDRILHIDFLAVDNEKPIIMEVPVSLDGHAAGVRAGGKLIKELRKLKVRATYDKIPERLHIDVTKLKLGKSLQVGELSFEGFEIVNNPNAVVASVRLTRAARGAAAAAGKAITDDEEEETEE